MSLASLLTDQQQRLDALISLLSSEQNLLTQGDIDGDALSQVALEKQSLLAELERIETGRCNVQKRLGYPKVLAVPKQLKMLAAKQPGKVCLKK